MADRSSGKLTVAELMARMGDAAPTSDADTQPTSRTAHARSEEPEETTEYVPRRLRGATSETPHSEYAADSYIPTSAPVSRTAQQDEDTAPQRAFSWNDIVQDTDWSAADKLEAWPHRPSGPDTADHPTQRIPAVEDEAEAERSQKSPHRTSLLDTYSSDFSSDSSYSTTAATYPEDENHYPYTAGMDVLSPEEVAEAQAEETAASAESAESEESAEPTVEDTAEDSSPVSRFFDKIKGALGRDTTDESLAATTRVLQVAQVVITAVVGGLLFWGFGVLWSKPGLGAVTFALALVVQIAMVVVARILRRREEFWVLILTFIVAFFVTVGPLIITP